MGWIIYIFSVYGDRPNSWQFHKNSGSGRRLSWKKLCNYKVGNYPFSFETSVAPVERQSTIFDSSHASIVIEGRTVPLSIWYL